MSQIKGLPQNIKELIETSSVNLVYVDGNGFPDGGGSGCLIDYHGKRYLFTVEHVTDDIPPGIKLKVVLGWDEQLRKTKLREPGTINFAHQGMVAKDAIDLSGVELKSIDLAYFEVPYSDVPELQDVGKDGAILSARSSTVWTEKQLTSPKVGDLCGFAGHTAHDTKYDPEIANDVFLRYTLFRKCYDITFEGQVDDYYAFKLPFAQPGEGYFEGTSGAPIVDIHGNVVALVSHGRPGKDYVYGVPIEKYKMVIDANRIVDQWKAGGKPYLEPR